jgi:hypothetical protein
MYQKAVRCQLHGGDDQLGLQRCCGDRTRCETFHDANSGFSTTESLSAIGDVE